MDVKADKCVMIVDDSMPIGVIANIVAIMGISMGKGNPDIVGIDAEDADNHMHRGLIQFPVPILKANSDKINELRQKLFGEEFSDVSVIDFSNVAQETYTYDDYLACMQKSGNSDLVYYGIAIEGPKKKVNKLTGSLPLLR